MESWKYTEVDNNKYAGIITAVSANATDAEMMDEFLGMEFEYRDKGKMVLIDRQLIEPDVNQRFMSAAIDDDQIMWATYGHSKPGLDMIQQANRIQEEITSEQIILTDDDLKFGEDYGLEQ